MPVKKMRVGIAIPLYEDPNIINAVREVLRQAKAIPECTFKIAVVDSSPSPVDYKKLALFKDPRIRIFCHAGTIGQARDLAVQNLADCDVILNLDSDCIPMENWISSYLELLKKYDLVYGIYKARGHWLSNVLISFGLAPLGGNMAYWRKVWVTVDGFKLPRYEDTLFLKKAKKAGYTFYFDPENFVIHLRPHGFWRTIKDDLILGGIKWLLGGR